MQLPSIQQLTATAGRVVRRFPLTLVCAALLCVVGVVAFSPARHATPAWLFPLGSAAGLGLTLTLALALAGERYGWSRLVRGAAQAGAALLLAGWYALVPTEPDFVWALRLLLLALGLHLAVATAPYLAELRRTADTPGFWRFNKTLLLRLLAAGLYSGVLFAGGSLALVAVRELFGINIDEAWFGYLFVVLGTLFNTWFFLAGVPADFEALEQDAPYPQGLKVFTQFVLLPLVVLYLVILYAYLGRILVHWELPEGWVSFLILALAVAGIFALLLIHPLRDNAENTWIRTFARWFYLALFPLLGLLAVAIGTRIRAYGLTEERYLVVLLALWLLGMAVYFLWRRGRGIIWLPATLGALAFAASAGPWGAFALSEWSQLHQLHQLRELAARHGLLRNGQLDAAAERVPTLSGEEQQRMSSIFKYFADRDVTDRLQPFFAGSLRLPDSLRTGSVWQRQRWLAQRPFELSGFDALVPYTLRNSKGRIEPPANFYVNGRTRYHALGQGRYWLKDVDSNDPMTYGTGGNVLLDLPLSEGHFRLFAPEPGDTILVQQEQATDRWQTKLRLDLRAPIDSLLRLHGSQTEVSMGIPGPLRLQASNGRLRLRLFFDRISREQSHPKVPAQYTYSAEGMLEVKP